MIVVVVVVVVVVPETPGAPKEEKKEEKIAAELLAKSGALEKRWSAEPWLR